MNLITLYAKKIPISAPLIKGNRLNFKKEFDVALFEDQTCLNRKATFDYWYSAKPTKRNKYVTINCAKYRLEWR